MRRAVDRSNPWGLTELEMAVLQALAQTGENELVAEKLGFTMRSVENALARSREKMGTASRVLLIAKFVTWTSRKYAERPRTAWVCRACDGFGFVTKMPGSVRP